MKIGHDRDYDDVLPLRGAYLDTTDHRLSVEAGIRRSQLTALRQSEQQ